MELVKTINSDNFIAKIDKPRASLGLSSTGETFLGFAKKHLNNGLLNRFVIYRTARSDNFAPDVLRRCIQGLGNSLAECKEVVYDAWQALRSHYRLLLVNISPLFESMVNEICRLMYERLVPKNNAYYGFAMRLPENILRLAVVFSTLKQYDFDGFEGEKIEVDCVEFVGAIHGCLLKNVEYAVDSIAGIELNYRGEIESEIDLSDLPIQFTAREFEKHVGLPHTTAFRKRKALEKAGLIRKIEGCRGAYCKTPSAL